MTLYRRHALKTANAIYGGGLKAQLFLLSLSVWVMVPAFAGQLFVLELFNLPHEFGQALGFFVMLGTGGLFAFWSLDWGAIQFSAMRGDFKPASRKIELLREILGEETE